MERPTTIIPTEEVAIRREYATKIEQNIVFNMPEFKFTTVHLAGIMITPLYNLHRGGFLYYRRPFTKLADDLNDLNGLLKRYLTQKPKRLARERRSTKNSDDLGADYFPPDNGGDDEKDICRKRDRYRCIFLQTAEGDVAHIIPRSWNDTRENMLLTRCYIAAARLFLDEDTFFEHQTTFIHPDNLRTTDKSWNMIYLEKQLHWLLDHTLVGMKCLGIEHDAEDDKKATVVIQLNWLYRSKEDPLVSVTCQGDENAFDRMLVGIQHFEREGMPARIEAGQGMYAAVRVNNNVPPVSGHVARIEMSSEDAAKCKVMLDLSWALSVVAAMSGAADCPELLPDRDDFDEIRQMAAVDQWVQDQTELNLEGCAPELPPDAPNLPHTPERPTRALNQSPARRISDTD